MVKVKLDLTAYGWRSEDLDSIYTTSEKANSIEIELQKAKYSNGRPAIQLMHIASGQVWATLTVNLPDHELDEGEFLIKSWSENEATARAIMDQTDLFVNMHKPVPTGFVEAETWMLADPKTLDNMREYGRRY